MKLFFYLILFVCFTTWAVHSMDIDIGYLQQKFQKQSMAHEFKKWDFPSFFDGFASYMEKLESEILAQKSEMQELKQQVVFHEHHMKMIDRIFADVLSHLVNATVLEELTIKATDAYVEENFGSEGLESWKLHRFDLKNK